MYKGGDNGWTEVGGREGGKKERNEEAEEKMRQRGSMQRQR